MCGIFLAYYHEGRVPSGTSLINVVKTVSHRGPDNIGVYKDERCFIGHTRLAIVGLEANSNQPFCFENLYLTFNGEIFNYVELRDELVAAGYKFTTHSDTEVVVKAYQHWGTKCFERFNGMWALAIYDKVRQVVVLSRDRFGQKPLFVLHTGSATFVASEFQQLVPFCSREIDYELISMFLKEGTYEGDRRTFFRSIEEFPKAHFCEVALDGSIRSERYWDYWSGTVEAVDETTYKEFEALLKDAVRIRLRADVPFSLLISGGVDSTIVAAYAATVWNKDERIRGFTYSAIDGEDERPYAEAVARKVGLDLTVKEQDADPRAYLGRLQKLVKHLGRGHSSPAIVSVDYLYEAVHEAGLKIAIDGQGADELLAGYKNYFLVVFPRYIALGQLRQAYLCFLDQFKSGFFSAILMFLRNVSPAPVKAVMRWIYGYEGFFKRFRAPIPRKYIPCHENQGRNPNALNRYLIFQHKVGLENLLYYGDIIAMRNGVENRSPFMDHRLVEMAFRVGDKIKLFDAIDKYALRRLPIYAKFKDELERPKIGFSSNIRRETKDAMVSELMASPILAWPIFTGRMRKAVNDGRLKRSKYERFLFRLYQVHLWNEVFVDERCSMPSADEADRERTLSTCV